MNIYQMTNKDTHARAVVVAKSAEAARCMRPDGKATHRGRGWIYAPGGAPSLACWPDDIEKVHADLAGRAAAPFDCPQVLVFDRDEQLRQPGEGPDESWGALFASLPEEERAR